MTNDVGHDFMTLLEKKFNSSYTWEQQWEKIDVEYWYDDPRYPRTPVQNNYNDFPASSNVFMVSIDE